jgi:hypothetical protein
VSTPTKTSRTHDCFRTTRLAGRCKTCGLQTSTAHVPTKLLGVYCDQCCPYCRPATSEQEKAIVHEN